LLGELEGENRVVVCDLEAGVGAVVRSDQADVVLAVAEPTVKSIEVARRAVEIAAGRARVVVTANRVRGEEDVDRGRPRRAWRP
jgi:CO dehydrogenase nickel-insertion accessory protein CooC1